MTRKIFCLIFLIASCQSNYEIKASKTDCAKFKKGIFFHRAEGDPTLYKIERSDTTQKEFIGKTGDFATLRIKWTGDCSYELTFLNQHINVSDSVPESYQQTKVKVDIIRVQNDTCFIVTNAGSGPLHGVVYIDKR